MCREVNDTNSNEENRYKSVAPFFVKKYPVIGFIRQWTENYDYDKM